jgi:hypothetical protein
MVYIITRLFTATFAFVVVVTGLALAVGLMPMAVLGLPVLAGTLILCSQLGARERGRAALLLDYLIAAPVWKRSPGGIGYLLKDRVAEVAEFVDALQRVAQGGSAIDPRSGGPAAHPQV